MILPHCMVETISIISSSTHQFEFCYCKGQFSEIFSTLKTQKHNTLLLKMPDGTSSRLVGYSTPWMTKWSE